MGRPEKELDPAAGPVQRFAHELRTLRREAGTPVYREMASRAGYSVTALSQAAAGDRLPTLPVALAFVAQCGGDREQWTRLWQRAEAEHLARLVARTHDEGTAPYRGLARFEPEDEAVFFGRGHLTDALTELVAAHRFSVVLGPSGSGKSSLLRAGLVPRLRRSWAPLPRAAALRILTPGAHPMRTHGHLLEPAPEPGETWLIVDQFEELFTLCADTREREEFLTHLLAARRPDSRLRVVVGVRADFHAHCLAHADLAAAIGEAVLRVSPLTAKELREAIVKPAAASGLVVERALTNRLVEEVASEPASLPLLSHALRETWRRRRGRALTLAAHHAAGGLHGAIAQTAEDLYAELTPAQERAARRILLGLVAPGDGAPDTRRPVQRAHVLHTGSPADTRTVLDKLARARLITLDHDTVDLTHEALITAWPRLRGWIDDNREQLRRHRRLTQASHHWHTRRRDHAALLRGGELAEAEQAFGGGGLLDLTPSERAFLRASSAARTRTRWARRAVTSVLSVLVVLTVLAGSSAWQQDLIGQRERGKAQEQRQEAAARRLSALAQNTRAQDPTLAMRLNLAAWSLKPTTETRSGLLTASAQQESDTYDVPDGNAPSQRNPVVLSQDGRTAVTSDATGLRAWNVLTRQPVGPQIPLDPKTTNLIHGFSPDGRRAVLDQDVAGPAGGDRTWDLTTGRPVDEHLQALRQVLGYTPDGGFIVDTTSAPHVPQNTIALRDPRTGRTLFERPVVRHPQWTVSPDNQLMALCTEGLGEEPGTDRDLPLQIWDVTGHRGQPTILPGGCGAKSLQFTGDGKSLMTLNTDGLHFWDPVTGKERAQIRQPGLIEATAAGDGQFVVAADAREIRMWRLATPDQPVFRHPLNNEVPRQLRIDPAAGVIRYVTERRRLDYVVRSLSFGPAMGSDWNQDPAVRGAFSQDGSVLAFERRTGDTFYTEAYRVADGRRLARTAGLLCPEQRPTGDDTFNTCHTLFALSPDGRTLAHARTSTVSDDEEKDYRVPTLWNVHTDEPLPTPRDPKPPYAARLPMTGLAFTGDGRRLLITRDSMDTADTWDLALGRRLAPDGQTEEHHSAPRSPYALSEQPPAQAVRPDGALLATPQRTYTLPSGRIAPGSRTADATGVPAFSPDSRFLAVGDGTGAVTLWDGDGTHERGILAAPRSVSRTGSADAVTALAFSPDATLLAVATNSGTVQLWDLPSGQPLGSALPTSGDRVVAVAFSPDGRTLRSVGEHGGVLAHPVDTRRLTAWVCKRAGGGLTRKEWETYLPGVTYRETCGEVPGDARTASP
ncbi:DNA-binding protein [Streptomyces sp. NPDC001691]|uniref:NACHT and WD repeat domain-containing protein n=1 Tax=Streptomyces sp. NPDC001691 TaxID=3364600 RepID=UPI00368EA456